MRNLRAVNLNLLPVLQALLRYRHVTQAARALDMSQSSVSEALGKLRQMFGDELLVSRGGHMILTAVAQRLEMQVESSLDSIFEILGADGAARPSRRRMLNIGAADYIVSVIGPYLVRSASNERPDLTIRFQNIDQRSFGKLHSGELDFLITADITLSPRSTHFEHRVLFEDRIVCLVDAQSPIGARVSEDAYWNARHVFYSPRSEFQNSDRSTILQQLGEKRGDAIIVQSYLLLPFFVRGADVIALAHQRLAELLVKDERVRISQCPLDITAKIQISWDNSHSPTPLRDWMLAKVSDFQQR